MGELSPRLVFIRVCLIFLPSCGEGEAGELPSLEGAAMAEKRNTGELLKLPSPAAKLPLPPATDPPKAPKHHLCSHFLICSIQTSG